MKRSLIFLTFILSAIILVACGPSVKEARAEVSETITSGTLLFRIRIVDPDSEVTSPVVIKLKGSGFEKEFTEAEIFTVQKEFKFDNLTPSQKYTLTVYAKKDDKDVQLFKKEYETNEFGTSDENPILIGTVDEFLAITDVSKFYKQTADLDFGDRSIAPLFKSSNGFKGGYDGDGFVIKNINIVDAEHVENIYLSVFGYVNTGKIHNLVFDNIRIDNSAKPVQNSSYVSIVVSKTASTSAILDNITVKNSTLTIKHNQRLGSNGLERSSISRNLYTGIVLASGQGTVTNISVENSKVDVVMPEVNIAISSANYLYIGGIVGLLEENRAIKVDNLYADVDIDLTINGTQKENKAGLIYVGGLLGAHLGNSNISSPASTGWISTGTIDINYQTYEGTEEEPDKGTQDLTAFRVGGLVGHANVAIDQAYSAIAINFTANQIKSSNIDIATTVGYTMYFAKRVISNGTVSITVSTEITAELFASLYGIKKPWSQLNQEIKTIESEVLVNGVAYENLHEVIALADIHEVIDSEWILKIITEKV